MTNISCTRRMEFDAAHRLIGHEGKCRHLHGHRYMLEATFSAGSLDDLGRVVDFGVIKERLGAWIDSNWDHNTILSEQDRPLGDAITNHTKQGIFYLPANPTAENMADYLFRVVCPTLFAGENFTCTRLRLYETPNCSVDAT